MRHNRIITIIVFSLFLFSWLATKAQVEPDENGYVDKERIIYDFRAKIDTLNPLPSSVIEGNEKLCKETIIGPFILEYFPWDTEVRIRDCSNPNKDQNQIQTECVQEMLAILKERLARDEEAAKKEQQKENETNSFDWRIVALIACILLLILLIVFFVRIMSLDKKPKPIKRKQVSTSDNPPPPQPEENDPGIVVRRKTETIMRKQNLDDVVDNGNYMEIDSRDFCADSMIRRVFIKNSCIKGIYNMYAEDLRNPNNPKEDGCMVLGRWVPDKASGEYDISLEEIVLPGDDAVFSEYELNFGFKISHTVGERLKKLRRETDHQYDLTCWIHSHPGLGVFFSNSDVNVQTQLKHPSHPNFLIAIVIDILTPKQDLGIFTFKHDASINTKTDLIRLYSLEEWYQWALKCERNAFKQEDYYDTLTNAKMHTDSCHSIQLDNSTIIDISLLSANPNGELVRWIHGFKRSQNEQTTQVTAKVSENYNETDNELIGAFVMAAHCSIPSVRKAVSEHLEKISFVLVYSTSNGILTSIPVINNELSADDNYYGAQNMEDLKIWTRRKR